MNKPITDLEVLRSEYDVKGWTWKVHGGEAWLWREDSSGTQWSAGMLDGMLVVNIWPGGICSCLPEVAITVGCAYRGVPTPWRAAEKLRERSRAIGADLVAQCRSGYPPSEEYIDRLRDQANDLDMLADELDPPPAEIARSEAR